VSSQISPAVDIVPFKVVMTEVMRARINPTSVFLLSSNSMHTCLLLRKGSQLLAIVSLMRVSDVKFSPAVEEFLPSVGMSLCLRMD
jgi:hypothetical protein